MIAHQFLFYAPALSAGDRTIALPADESHHVARVLRARPGDALFVTNGRGVMVRAVVERVDARRSTVSVEGEVEMNVPARRVTLALALLRKGAFERALEACTEAGITTCVPFVAEQCHASEFSPAVMERLRRIAVSAMKQSFRPILPEIAAPESFSALVERCRAAPHAVVGDSSGTRAPAPPVDEDVIVVVGPEGGLVDDEREALRDAGANLVSISPHRLRAETAALALVAHTVRGPD